MKSLNPEQAQEFRRSLVLPDDIDIVAYLGSGARSHVFRAVLDGDDVIVKAYRDEAAEKYARRYGVDIAEFEYGRNRALYELDPIRRYVARPCRVHPRTGAHTHSIVQEYIGGQTLGAVIKQVRHLPAELLEAGYRVIRAAEAHGIHDLDISSGNVRVVDEDGERVLKLYDFNLMPQHLAPPNPFVWLALKLGLRRKSHRDYRNLRKWEWRGRKVQAPASR